ncbi:MAG: endo alpha-1,4 polygalactosaminidase [Treponema sp.]|nr:endo alpha-1,4 polygalactosaminidase [Treponema sp.]
MIKVAFQQVVCGFSCIAALFSCAGGTTAREVPEESRPGTFRFGVFTGLGRDRLERLEGYDTAVIDAHYYTDMDIAVLHGRGIRVYAYCNIGSIEEFRPYYKDFEPLTLGPYEGWENERWINIAAPAWRRYLVEELARDLVRKGADGFFIDNTDLYYYYPQEAIYEGILDVLERLEEAYGLPLIINGGDVFMREALDRKALPAAVRGANQESVFTLPDLRTGLLGRQNAETSRHYQAYLSRCRAAGLEVFITEYLQGDAALRKQILDYCEQNGFTVFFAGSLALDSAGR